ncbi:hypothetical protein BGW36DRAFT_303514 [Talaromyces proteolyticus]|uniref:Mid2 domain-containing protein n=1 Tax=Talaromyces proteolyticus TaxID=1131652 RepID=A0AAD4KIS9_9EURO|nr:uncharacterized protein BGW36DRAFT_303514 [Talaromyces proteolyticus]KAH8692049.1 hypothetical protein BGW36DRAFT_303514 [Talaromyces proteolyticus]
MYTLGWAVGLTVVLAGQASSGMNIERRSANTSPVDPLLRGVRRALIAATVDKRDPLFSNSTSLDKSFDGAVLFSFEQDASQGNLTESISVEITCTACYITGTATVQFTIDNNFNASQAFHQFLDSFESEVDNITSQAITGIENYVKTEAQDILSLDFQDISYPTIPLNFTLDIPPIPQCHLKFQFDGLELYMLLDTTLSVGATYTLNLFTSKDPIGIAIGENLLLGVVFAIDLILDVNAEIDIRSGFHIKLDDGAALDINMFNTDVANIALKGGHFEFLPVRVSNAGATFSAILRLSIHAGLETGERGLTVDGHTFGNFSTGIEVGVFINVAEFITNVTTPTVSDSNSSCEIQVMEEYRFAVGAEAGATLAVDKHSWGPSPETTIPIWYTTLEACAAQTTPSTTSVGAGVTARAARRQNDLTTTTISTAVTYTGVECQSSGLVNCPVSLQSTSTFSITSTLVTAVASGSTATFPATVQNTVLTTIPFGLNAQTMTATSGSPVSYTPQATHGSVNGSGRDDVGGLSEEDKRIAIGVSVGVGVPVLIAIAAGC